MKSAAEPRSSEITPEPVWRNRRAIVKSALAMPALGSLVGSLIGTTEAAAESSTGIMQSGGPGAKLSARPGQVFSMEKATPYKDVTTYNNYYEFGTEKEEPSRNAHTLKTRPWTITVDGLVDKPRTFDLDELLKLAPLEERIFRMRCVEGWSMVIPWIGFSLSELIKRLEPASSAKYVEFHTLADAKQMPGLKSSVLQWPYVEALRLDEARHPLTTLAVGLYGEVMPNQNGAPVRVVIPWKYGFKSGKSIVKIRFVEKQPITSWNRAAPHEYGFFSNVNPEVDHPRWSQATERRIGEDGFLQRKRKTLMFNGYADQVASLYTGMDLKLLF
jgi:methionine sulfoxide reductase catalytic subunit